MLSARGQNWAKTSFLHGGRNPYHPSSNPNGVVDFSYAENFLIHEEITRYINTRVQFSPQSCSYGEGYTGTVRLRSAMAKHLNTHLKPVHEIDLDQITFAAGVTSLSEACAQVLCNPDSNESIMLGGPIYGSFSRDLAMRTGLTPEYVDVGGVEQFSPDCVAAYEASIEAAKARGVTIKAMIICNPHNPLGRCYPRETLVGLMRLCAARGIHLLSDEIYALSVYERDDVPCEKFTSVRSIDPAGIIDPALVHVFYGMSKDFGVGGMRLGCVVSENTEFVKAIRAVCRFISPSQYSMEIAANLLEDEEYVAKFLEKSQGLLARSRMLAEKLLTEAGIGFHLKGNAGFFIWLDLSPFLPLDETNGDKWAAERLLSQRFEKAGVNLSTGEAYSSPNPGGFRLVFSLEEGILKEGIRRIKQALVA